MNTIQCNVIKQKNIVKHNYHGNKSTLHSHSKYFIIKADSGSLIKDIPGGEQRALNIGVI